MMHQQQRPMRQGTPKIVPIIMSAGLAVGVFCGLLFGVGKKSEAIAAEPSKGNNVKPATETPAAKADPGSAPAGLGATAAKPVPAAGSGAKPGTPVAAAGSAAPPPPPPTVEVKKTKLIVVIKTAAAKDAKLYIDGEEVEGLTTEVPVDRKTIKVEVKANGFRSYEKKLDLTPGELTLEIEMAKKSSGTPGVRPPKRPDKPPSGGGGLIDI